MQDIIKWQEFLLSLSIRWNILHHQQRPVSDILYIINIIVWLLSNCFIIKELQVNKCIIILHLLYIHIFTYFWLLWKKLVFITIIGTCAVTNLCLVPFCQCNDNIGEVSHVSSNPFKVTVLGFISHAPCMYTIGPNLKTQNYFSMY